MLNETESTVPQIRRRYVGRELILLPLAIAISINVAWFIGQMSRRLSRMDAFLSVSIDMPREEMRSRMLRSGIQCEIMDPRSTQCSFSDLWRDYSIGVNPVTGLVSVKRVRYAPLF